MTEFQTRRQRHMFNVIQNWTIQAKRASSEARQVLTWDGEIAELPYEATKRIMDTIFDLELVVERCGNPTDVAELRAASSRVRAMFKPREKTA